MPIKPRYGSETHGLPLFRINDGFANVCKATARIDHYEIHYYANEIRYPDEGVFDSWIRRVTNGTLFSPAYRRGRRENEHGGDTPPHAEMVGNELQFRPGLIRGRRIIFNSLPRHRQYHSRDAKIWLNLNFTRFYQNNYITENDLPPSEENISPREYMRNDSRFLFDLQEQRFALIQEASLDGNDNAFIGRRWRETSDVPAMLVHQVMLTRAYIERQWAIPRIHCVPQYHWDTFSIPHLEIYWDMHCDNAVATLDRLAPNLRGYFAHGMEKHHNSRSVKHSNLQTFEGQITKNVILRVYAKTERRLRMEIIYKRNLRTIFQRHARRLGSLYSLIDHALDDATERLQLILADMQLAPAPPQSGKPQTLARLNLELHDVFEGDYSEIKNFLELISRFGSASISPANAAPYEALVERVILERYCRRRGAQMRQYRFTPQYQWIIHSLMD